MSAPKVIFGAASIGMDFKNVSAVCEVLDLLEKNGVLQIDTAGRYPPVSPGLSETLLGEAKATEKGFILDTKILAGPGDGSGELEEPAIAKSLFNSLERLGVSTVRDSRSKLLRPKAYRSRFISFIVIALTHGLLSKINWPLSTSSTNKAASKKYSFHFWLLIIPLNTYLLAWRLELSAKAPPKCHRNLRGEQLHQTHRIPGRL